MSDSKNLLNFSNTLFLFTSKRAQKEFLNTFENPCFLPPSRDWRAFLDEIIFVENTLIESAKNNLNSQNKKIAKVPKFLRDLFLHKSINEVRNAEILGDFGDNFSKFLDNSSFFFDFFDELANECVRLEDIPPADTYAFFEDHLEILKEIYQKYCENLHNAGFYDNFFGENYKIANELLSGFCSIVFFADGFLGRFEWRILQHLAEFLEIRICLNLDEFNNEYYNRLCGLKIPSGAVILRLFSQNIEILKNEDSMKFFNFKPNDKEILTCDKNDKKDSIESALLKTLLKGVQKPLNRHLSLALDFYDKPAMVGAIFAQIDTWLAEGYKSEDIVIVLSDENFSEFLRLFDSARNFNFGSGDKIEEAPIFRDLKEYLESFKQSAQTLTIAKLKEHYENFSQNLDNLQNIEPKAFLNFQKSDFSLNQSAKEALDEAFSQIENVLNNGFCAEFSQNDLCYCVLNLAKRRIDDKSGGKISVLGFLEARGLRAKCIVLPEFSDENVPHRVQKDIFLNSAIRARVGLPTQKDRQNLQKHYLSELFCSVEKVLILSLNNDDSTPSRFLKDERIFAKITSGGRIFSSVKKFESTDEFYKIAKQYFFASQNNANATQIGLGESEIIDKFDFILSPSSLKTLQNCARKFYYQKKLKLKAHSSQSAELGSFLHLGLEKMYSELKANHTNFSKLNAAMLWEIFKNTIQELKNSQLQSGKFLGKSAENITQNELFELDLALEKMHSFFKQEEEYFASGWEIMALEQNFSFSFCGFTFCGKIDRVDRAKSGNLRLIDYKSSQSRSLEAKNYALELCIYLLFLEQSNLLQSSANTINTGIYSILSGKFSNLEEEKINSKKQEIIEFLSEINSQKEKFNFRKTDKISNCSHCDFRYLCNRF